jgi:hypothetical protein
MLRNLLVRIFLILVLMPIPMVEAGSSATEFEKPPALPGQELVPATLLSGPGFTVGQPVPTDGLMAHFIIRSSLSALAVTHRAKTGGISDALWDSRILSQSVDCCQACSHSPALRSVAGGVYSLAAEFLAELDSKLKLDKLQTMESWKPRSYAGQSEEIKPS